MFSDVTAKSFRCDSLTVTGDAISRAVVSFRRHAKYQKYFIFALSIIANGGIFQK